MYNTSKTIRVNKEEWQQASSICSSLNTTLSGEINQLIKQIIIQERVPFMKELHKKEKSELPSKENQKETPFDNSYVPVIGTTVERSNMMLGQNEFSQEESVDFSGALL